MPNNHPAGGNISITIAKIADVNRAERTGPAAGTRSDTIIDYYLFHYSLAVDWKKEVKCVYSSLTTVIKGPVIL